MRTRLFSLLAVALFALASVPATTYAQNAAGVGIRPATIEEPADPGQAKQYAVTVSNLSGVEQTLYLFTRDIVGVRAGGVPIFANEGAEKTGYELSEWVTLETSELTLGPGEERVVNFTIAVPGDAAPGSHFGGVFVSVEPPRLRSSGAAVGYEVANIISIQVAGDIVERASIRSFSTDNYLYGSSNVSFHATIRNEGNVLIRPYGPLEIFNMFGSRVALLTFNESERGVFPGTDRDDFVITWDDEGPGFGRYQARLALTYGTAGKSTIYSEVSFWVLPMNIIGPALGVLAVLLAIAYVGVRLYVRRTLAMYGTPANRRLVRRRRQGASPFLLVTVVMLSVTAVFLIILLLLFA